MLITVNPVYQWDDSRDKYVLISHEGVYEWSGPVELACSSGGDVAVQDRALQDAQTQMTQNLNADYATTFAENQQVAKSQMAKANYLMANPMGLTAPELATARTSINENNATAARQAIGAASAFAASHGGADVGGGGAAQEVGQIASDAAQSKAQQLAALSNQNQEMKRQSFLTGLSELNNAGSNLSGQGSTAISGAGESATSAVKAGSGELAAKEAGWQEAGAMISGIGGLAEAGIGMGSNISKGLGAFS
jgi:hypothetical protein